MMTKLLIFHEICAQVDRLKVEGFQVISQDCGHLRWLPRQPLHYQ